jgi:hypothetical protein
MEKERDIVTTQINSTNNLVELHHWSLTHQTPHPIPPKTFRTLPPNLEADLWYITLSLPNYKKYEEKNWGHLPHPPPPPPPKAYL